MGDVAGVVVPGCLAERGLGAPVGGAEFGDEFLDGVGVVAESSGELSGEPCGVSGPVGVFLSAPRCLVSSDSCCIRHLVAGEDAACAGDGTFGGRADEAGVAVGPAGEIGEAVVVADDAELVADEVGRFRLRSPCGRGRRWRGRCCRGAGRGRVRGQAS